MEEKKFSEREVKVDDPRHRELLLVVGTRRGTLQELLAVAQEHGEQVALEKARVAHDEAVTHLSEITEHVLYKPGDTVPAGTRWSMRVDHGDVEEWNFDQPQPDVYLNVKTPADAEEDPF